MQAGRNDEYFEQLFPQKEGKRKEIKDQGNDLLILFLPVQPVCLL